MSEIRDRLVDAAVRARAAAYAPYSGYAVGAALWCGGSGTASESDAAIYAGTNIENASYGLTVCAERVAIFRWVADGRRGEITEIAVAAGPADSVPTGGRPCGACLQVIREFAEDPVIHLVGEEVVVETRLSALLPDPFIPPFGPGGAAATE